MKLTPSSINNQSQQSVTLNLRFLVTPIITLIVLVVLVAGGASVLFGKIGDASSKLSESRKSQSTLENKLEVLQSYDAGFLTQSEGTISQAFPDSNPVLPALAVIRSKAGEYSVEITDYSSSASAGGDDKTAVNEVRINFTVAGNFTDAFSFLKALDHVAPVVKVLSAKSGTKTANQTTAVEVSVYWAGYPDKLPAISTPVVDLAQSEKDILNKIAGYESTGFTVLSPTEAIERVDPFRY